MRSLLSMSAALVVALSLTACGTMTNEAAVSAEGFPTRTADGLLVVQVHIAALPQAADRRGALALALAACQGAKPGPEQYGIFRM